MVLFGFGVLGYLLVLLLLMLFVLVLMMLLCMYCDLEMVVWFFSGLFLCDWINLVLCFVVFIIVFIFVLLMYLVFWVQFKSGEMCQCMDQCDDVLKVLLGVFCEFIFGDKIFFVEGVFGVQSGNGQVKNVFMNLVQYGCIGIMVVVSGYVEQVVNGDCFVVFEKGYCYEGMLGMLEYCVMEFECYVLCIEICELCGVEVLL